MKENTNKTKIVEKQPVYGVISPTTDPIICEYLGFAGLDFYMIDAEHGAISIIFFVEPKLGSTDDCFLIRKSTNS